MSEENRYTLLQNLQIATAIMVSIFGIYTAWQSNRSANISSQNSIVLDKIKVELQNRKQETERVQEFTKRIQEQLPNLTGANPKTAKISLASLYALAENSETYKSILFTIAIASDNDALKSTFKDLILEDSSATNEFKKQIEIKLSKRITPISSDSKTTESESPQLKEQARVEKALLQQLTQQQSRIVGWIYLGKVRSGNSTLEAGKTIKSNQVPSVTALVETSTSVYLRESAPTGKGLGAIKGILSENSKLKVKSLKKTRIDSDYHAVWVEVNE